MNLSPSTVEAFWGELEKIAVYSPTAAIRAVKTPAISRVVPMKTNFPLYTGGKAAPTTAKAM